MYNTHPTIIDQNSRFYNESAKLSCIFNDISAKQESIITQSAPEQVIWVWEIASEGARWGFGLLSNMPTPEAYEPRVGLAVQLAIFNRGCEPEGVFINLTIQLKNAPSSEPDAGEWRVPYAVFKPIKDGIIAYVKGIANAVEDFVEGTGSSDDVISALFGPFAEVLKVLMEINKAIMNIVKPFFDLVNNLLSDVNDFIMGLLTGAIGGNKDATDPSVDNVEETEDSNLIVNLIKIILGIDTESSSKGDFTGLEIANVVLIIIDLFPALTLIHYNAGTGCGISAIIGLILSTAGLLCCLFNYLNPVILSVVSIGLSFFGLFYTAYGFVTDSLTKQKYVDGILLLWGGICCAVSSLRSIEILKEEGFIP